MSCVTSRSVVPPPEHSSRMRPKLLCEKYASPTPRISSTTRISGLMMTDEENMSREHIPVE